MPDLSKSLIRFEHELYSKILLSGKICTFAHVTSVYFATSKVTKEAEILQEGFSLIYRRVKLLPDGNNLDKSMYPEMNKPPRGKH